MSAPSNKIQIKRSQTTTTPGSLADGELAWSGASEKIFIGDYGSVVAIGGKHTPGVLTANQAIVTDNSNNIDHIYVTGSATIYNTSFDDGVISGGSYNTNKVDFKSGDALTIQGGNYGVTISASSDRTNFKNTVFNADGSIKTQGSIIPDVANTYSIGSSSNTWNNAYFGGTVSTRTLNTSFLTANGVTNPGEGYLPLTDSTGKIYWKDSAHLAVGPEYITNTASRQLSGNLYFSGANTYIDNLFIGSGYASGNGYGLTSVDAAKLGGQTLTQVLSTASGYADNAFANAALRADSAFANAYAKAVSYTDSTTATAFANAAARAASAYSNAVSYVQNYTGFVNKTSDSYVASISGGTGVTVSGGTGNGSTPSISIGQSVGTTDDVTFNTGNFLNVISNTSIISNTATIYHNLVVGGDILVTGNIVSSNIESIQVSDPLLHLGTNNHVSDALDIGFFADYYDSAQGLVQYTGLVRDASDKIYKLFQHLDTDPNPLVNFNETTTATLQAYLISSGLTTNSTAVSITATNDIRVALVANTLTLSTPLAYDSGGTGFNTYATGDLLVGNTAGGQGLSKLTLGSAGYFLQSDGTNLIYSNTIDGGTY